MPHVAATARQPQRYVWAVDAARCPDYGFPRQCPRAMAWATPLTTDADRERILGGDDRVHAVEYRCGDRQHHGVQRDPAPQRPAARLTGPSRPR
ncbi:DUF6886 family protein [Amycolatopsis sp. GA6-003]|uniref:DUF6886 family protein n=1 Tax=Amycolatopsis sp. GA6-003 TaxID=2652444 RepID=UPI003916D68F